MYESLPLFTKILRCLANDHSRMATETLIELERFDIIPCNVSETDHDQWAASKSERNQDYIIINKEI